MTRSVLIACATLLLAACSHLTPAAQPTGTQVLAMPSPLPFQAPPYDRLHDADFRPAIEAAMRKNLAEIRAIDSNAQPPTFDDTIVALERSGVDLRRAE